jgi:hypothetical protein
MHIAINTASQFRDEFRAAGRAEQFSHEGLGLLFDYLEEIDPDYDLDVVGLCCDYSEDSPENIAKAYDINIEGMDEEQINHEVMEYLQNNYSVVGCTASSIVYCSSF